MSILELDTLTRPALAFHLPCVPPTTTHQHKRIVRVGRFARLADRPELVQARHDLEALLQAHRPPAPLTGPVRLELAFTWPWLKGHSAKLRALGRVRKVTKPDCSNLAKTLEDRLTFLRFLEDDAQVAALSVEKWHGDQPGITVRLEAMRATTEPEPPSVPEPAADLASSRSPHAPLLGGRAGVPAGPAPGDVPRMLQQAVRSARRTAQALAAARAKSES